MARIAGVNLPLNKRTEIGLTYVHGIGDSTAQKILAEDRVDPNTRVGDLTEDEVIKLRDAVEEYQVEGDLRRERSQNVKRLMEIGSYRGLRHRRGLPVNGQRTKTNARSRKGPKKMSVAGQEEGPDAQVIGGFPRCRSPSEQGPFEAPRQARTCRSARPTSRPASTTRSSP